MTVTITPSILVKDSILIMVQVVMVPMLMVVKGTTTSQAPLERMNLPVVTGMTILLVVKKTITSMEV